MRTPGASPDAAAPSRRRPPGVGAPRPTSDRAHLEGQTLMHVSFLLRPAIAVLLVAALAACAPGGDQKHAAGTLALNAPLPTTVPEGTKLIVGDRSEERRGGKES